MYVLKNGRHIHCQIQTGNRPYSDPRFSFPILHYFAAAPVLFFGSATSRYSAANTAVKIDA